LEAREAAPTSAASPVPIVVAYASSSASNSVSAGAPTLGASAAGLAPGLGGGAVILVPLAVMLAVPFALATDAFVDAKRELCRFLELRVTGMSMKHPPILQTICLVGRALAKFKQTRLSERLELGGSLWLGLRL